MSWELQSIVTGCKKVLNTAEGVLVKYDKLGKEAKYGPKLWQQIRFGNGELHDMAEIKAKIVYYTSAISLFLNMVAIGSMGRVEKQMNDAGEELQEIRIAVNGITAYLAAKTNYESSVLTTYADDEKAVWKASRRELLAEGFSSWTVRKHKGLIKA